ncbi:hypothetical protein LZ32DRAFT_603449 [Colletotrichum eremochloae]|nr:hypothetical protein LZ32DRAFT_603449 [Colletotrichum eremochloae]
MGSPSSGCPALASWGAEPVGQAGVGPWATGRTVNHMLAVVAAAGEQWIGDETGVRREITNPRAPRWKRQLGGLRWLD